MFQTDLVVALQSFGSDALTRVLLAVTVLGFSDFQIPLVIVLAFGVNLRKGLILVQILLVTSILTEHLKVLFALPRPADIDPAVSYMSGGTETIEAAAYYRDAPTFLSALPAETVRFLRAANLGGYGFPSGHCSGTAALWTSIGLLFRRRAVWAIGAAAILLVAFSRVYLGRHFLADVIGGIVVGIAVVACFAPILRKRVWSRMESKLTLLACSQWGRGLTLYLIGLPVVSLAFATPQTAEDIGRLFGVNLGFMLVAWHGLPDDAASLGRRALRVLLAAFCYFCLSRGVGAVAHRVVPHDAAIVRLAAGALVTLPLVVVSVEAGVRLRLFGPRRGDCGTPRTAL